VKLLALKISIMEKIMLVEDDPDLSLIIREYLEELDFEVYYFKNGEEALSIIDQVIFDLLLIDVDLGERMSGFEMAEIVRKKYKVLPVIFTTAKNGAKDLQRGFGIGHVDYLKKPFGVKELSLRINALLNRDQNQSCAGIIRLGMFSFYYIDQILSEEHEKNHLTKQEATFLKILCENMGNVVSIENFVKVLWKYEDDPLNKERAINNLAYRLRMYMKKDPTVVLENIQRSGYKLFVLEK
jgi:two-component system, OmpR family, response regulator TrcR